MLYENRSIESLKSVPFVFSFFISFLSARINIYIIYIYIIYICDAPSENHDMDYLTIFIVAFSVVNDN